MSGRGVDIARSRSISEAGWESVARGEMRRGVAKGEGRSRLTMVWVSLIATRVVLISAPVF